jgi:hypothetical protein
MKKATAATTTTTVAAIPSGSQLRSGLSRDEMSCGPVLTSEFYTRYQRNMPLSLVHGIRRTLLSQGPIMLNKPILFTESQWHLKHLE